MSISDFEQESEIETSTTRTTDNEDTNSRKRQRHEKNTGGTKRSFIWKFFKVEKDANSSSEVMKCGLLDHNGQPCTTQYLTHGSTSNAIQHLANVHSIVEKGKLHVKVLFCYNIILFLYYLKLILTKYKFYRQQKMEILNK